MKDLRLNISQIVFAAVGTVLVGGCNFETAPKDRIESSKDESSVQQSFVNEGIAVGLALPSTQKLPSSRQTCSIRNISNQLVVKPLGDNMGQDQRLSAQCFCKGSGTWQNFSRTDANGNHQVCYAALEGVACEISDEVELAVLRDMVDYMRRSADLNFQCSQFCARSNLLAGTENQGLGLIEIVREDTLEESGYCCSAATGVSNYRECMFPDAGNSDSTSFDRNEISMQQSTQGPANIMPSPSPRVLVE